MRWLEAPPDLLVTTEGRRDTAEALPVPVEAVSRTGAPPGMKLETIGCLTAREMIVDDEIKTTATMCAHVVQTESRGTHVVLRETPLQVDGRLVTTPAAVPANAVVRVRPFAVTDVTPRPVDAVGPGLEVPSESELIDTFRPLVDGTAVSRVTGIGAETVEVIGAETMILEPTGLVDQIVTTRQNVMMTIRTGTETETDDGVTALVRKAVAGAVHVDKCWASIHEQVGLNITQNSIRACH